MRTFETGATRNNDAGKLDYDGFLSPLVLKRYAEYLHKHRLQADGKLRDSDNWQRGIPVSAYMKSLWRHFMDMWSHHRGNPLDDVTFEDAICAVLFNAMGYLHETLKAQQRQPITDPARPLPAEAESLKPQTCGKHCAEYGNSCPSGGGDYPIDLRCFVPKYGA